MSAEADALVAKAVEIANTSIVSFDRAYAVLLEVTGWVDRAQAAEAKVAAVEAVMSEMRDTVVTLLQEHNRTGADSLLSYANCTAMDEEALRKALAMEVAE